MPLDAHRARGGRGARGAARARDYPAIDGRYWRRVESGRRRPRSTSPAAGRRGRGRVRRHGSRRSTPTARSPRCGATSTAASTPTDQVYLDYTGGGLHAASQIDAHAELLRTTVLGNPHSNNPTSLATTALVERARRPVLEFFNAPPDEYLCIFTANASAALRLVGESYPFAPGGTFALTFDNHNSVNGIREFARRKGAPIAYVPVVAPELRLDRAAMTRVLGARRPGAPATCSPSPRSRTSPACSTRSTSSTRPTTPAGTCCVDAAAFAPTNRLDVGPLRPDFVDALVLQDVRLPDRRRLPARAPRPARAPCARPWFAGGTITIASVQGDGHYLHDDEAGVRGRHRRLPQPAGRRDRPRRTSSASGATRSTTGSSCLTAWLLDALGRPAPRQRPAGRRRSSGPTDTDRPRRHGHVRRCTTATAARSTTGASRSWPTGSASRCAPAASATPAPARSPTTSAPREMRRWFERDEPCRSSSCASSCSPSYDAPRRGRSASPSAWRPTSPTSTGFLCFLQGFVDRTVDEIGQVEFVSDNCRIVARLGLTGCPTVDLPATRWWRSPRRTCSLGRPRRAPAVRARAPRRSRGRGRSRLRPRRTRRP